MNADLIKVLVAFRPASDPGLKAFVFPFYRSFAETRKWPRFYMSTAWLSAYGSEFLYGSIGGCLCVVKLKVIHRNVVCHLVLPPMHHSGTVTSEANVLDLFRRMGVGAKVSEEDLELWGVDLQASPDLQKDEFVYRIGLYTQGLNGPSFYRWRKQVSQWNRSVDQDEVDFTIYEPEATFGISDQVTDLVRRWEKVKGVKILGRKLGRVLSAGSWTGVLRHQRKVIAAQVYDHPYPGAIHEIVGVHDYIGHDGPFTDLDRLMRILSANHWAKELGPQGLITSGAAVGVPGLAAMKERLHPEKVLRIFTVQPLASGPTIEDYRAITNQRSDERPLF